MTYDKDGREKSLTVLGVGSVAGGLDLKGDGLTGVLKALSGGAQTGKRVEFQSTLDLTDPERPKPVKPEVFLKTPANGSGLAVPASAVLYGPDGATVQVVRANRVETRRIKTGLAAGALVEVREGLEDGDLVVARSGTFLRDGDAVQPVLAGRAKLSEAR